MPMNSIGPVALLGATLTDLTQPIDYAAARKAGVQAVYFRASAGCEPPSPALAVNAAQARGAELPVGYFHIMNARTAPEARTQARRFLDAVRPLPGQLRPALQFENISGLTIEQANALALEFLMTVEYASGIVPVMYTSAESASLLWSRAIAERYPLWIIESGAGAPRAASSPWNGWVGWQYTDTAAVAGIPGPVRLSRFTRDIEAEAEDACVSPAPPDSKLICVTTVYGDTLSGIVALFGTTVEDIARINRISDPNRIFPGARLYLRVPLSTPVSPCEDYVVRRGDTLSDIADRLGIGLDALIARNQIANPSLIYPGQVLMLS